MRNFAEVASLDQVPPGSGTSYTVAGKGVAVFNVDGTIYAMDDTCLYQSSSLGAGRLDRKIVTCRARTAGATRSPPGAWRAPRDTESPPTRPKSSPGRYWWPLRERRNQFWPRIRLH
jgi:phenylpropionate dioxygenase-like ring-hydroxylating dioxygenase large terminal subunit